MTTYIDIHILHDVPPSNINRDDTGSPKSAVYGGVRRARVSSQAWKRATRIGYRDFIDETQIGHRTTRLVELLAARIAAAEGDVGGEEAERLATQTLSALGLKLKAARASKGNPTSEPEAPRTEYLVFLSAQQLEALAELAMRHRDGKVPAKEAKDAVKVGHGIDVALFGRMVADDASLNVDAAVQVAHALSTHAVEIESDYYTAVDDDNPAEETGAGMIGTIEFNSATLYRYATINVDRLHESLGDPAVTAQAAAAFVRSFVRSMPTGKLNTFGNRTLPEGVLVMVRNDQPISLVGAFENAMTADTSGGFMVPSARAFAAHSRGISQMYGAYPAQAWHSATPRVAAAWREFGEALPFDRLIEHVADAVRPATGAS